MDKETAEKLMGWLEQVGDFVAEQAPPLAQEILRWMQWEAVVSIAVTSVVMFVLCRISGIYLRKIRAFEADSSKSRCTLPDHWWCFVVGGYMVSAVLLIPLTFDVRTIVKVSVAPRYALMQQAQMFMAGDRCGR